MHPHCSGTHHLYHIISGTFWQFVCTLQLRLLNLNKKLSFLDSSLFTEMILEVKSTAELAIWWKETLTHLSAGMYIYSTGCFELVYLLHFKSLSLLFFISGTEMLLMLTSLLQYAYITYWKLLIRYLIF